MKNILTSLLFLAIAIATCNHVLSFSPSIPHVNHQASTHSIKHSLPSRPTSAVLQMGFFDGISKAFANQEYKAEDQRVRASHILIKGDDVSQVLGRIKQIMGELNDRMQTQEAADSTDLSALQRIFSELARRESQCPSAAQGGDLGLFAPGKMVQEFDDVLFPEEGAPPPPVGSIVGPVVTDFGCHVILVTKRETNRDQVEEKLARND